MAKITTIPNIKGFYWYFVPNNEPHIVSIDVEEHGENRFKSICGWKQSFVDKDAYFIGPIVPPKA